MEMTGELRDLFDYNRWANARVLDACEPVPAEFLSRDLGSSFPSVIATLGHVLSAEWVWLERWNGRSPSGPPAHWDLSAITPIRSTWRAVDADLEHFLQELDDARLGAAVEYRNTRGEEFVAPLWQLMRHFVNHSTYHRGQVATLLRQLGFPAVSTDLVLYHRTR